VEAMMKKKIDDAGTDEIKRLLVPCS